MKKICIIGGSGFVGTRLTGRLSINDNLNISIIDKNISKKFPSLTNLGDVRLINDLRKSISDESIIINLAAEHRDNVRPLSLYDEVNVNGAINICKVAREKGVKKIIFTSTVAVYGFAKIGIDEFGEIAPFNNYGRTKFEAEQIFKAWQAESPNERVLTIIRPTVIFGEQNRGNVYNLLRQISSGKFIMIGNGENRKSIAYVENVCAFIEFCINFKPGLHIFNFVDKPDFTMNLLVSNVNRLLGRKKNNRFKLPFAFGLVIGKFFDLLSIFSGKSFAISSIRIKKFCANSVYSTAIESTGFVSPVNIEKALAQTVHYEFIDSHSNEDVFYTE